MGILSGRNKETHRKGEKYGGMYRTTKRKAGGIMPGIARRASSLIFYHGKDGAGGEAGRGSRNTGKHQGGYS